MKLLNLLWLMQSLLLGLVGVVGVVGLDGMVVVVGVVGLVGLEEKANCHPQKRKEKNNNLSTTRPALLVKS